MRNFIYLMLAALAIGCNTTETKELQYFTSENDLFDYTGRFHSTDEGLGLISSAASVQIAVEGDTAVVYLKSGNDQHHYVALELNDEYLGRYQILDDSIPLALPENSKNQLKIFKDTEASNGTVIFKGLKAENITAIPDNGQPKIEFIGNSITCGMGADTREIPCGNGEWFDQHNAYLAYGPRVARALNAEYELSCVSGMGMYRNWNDEDQPVMPDVYPNLFLNENTGQKADFEGEAPDVVSVALGTNDLSFGDGEKERKDFNPEKFTQNYISFVEAIYNYYPNTTVALLSSPMVGERENEMLLSSLEKIKDHFNNKKIAIFKFSKMEPGGCTYHPDLEDHREMAEELVPFFEDLLNENS